MLALAGSDYRRGAGAGREVIAGNMPAPSDRQWEVVYLIPSGVSPEVSPEATKTHWVGQASERTRA